MLLRLRQACDHPFLVKGYHSMDSAGEASVKTAEKLPKDQLMNLLNNLESSLAICGICNDPPEDGVVTICRHVFCYECVSDFLTGDDNMCPKPGCRGQLSNAVVFSKATLLSCISDEPNGSSRSLSEVAESSLALPNMYGSSKIRAIVEFPEKHCKDESESSGMRFRELLKQGKRKYQEGNEPEHMPSSEPMMPDIPILHTQESAAKENDVHHTSVKDLHGNDVHIGNLSSCSEAHTTRVESLEVGELVEEPVVATMNPSFPNCQTHDSTSLIVPTSIDAIPSLKGSTSASAQERVDEFVFVDNFKIPKEYEILYKKVHGKYGHIATKKVIKSSDTVLVACVSDLLRIISAMETKRGVELSEELLKEWEGIIKDAEALKFNVKWFREGFDRLKSQWMSDSDEQVLDAMQGEYVGLCTRKDELETDLSEVKIQMKKAEAKISSKREAIREKQTQKFIFQNEPVLRIVLN
ncbi:hypothetical protein MKW92_046916 [Papaver armeniacum]|nr:hypothetical protein MKW92_046916 [Papaver armeniacum]